MEDNRLWIKLNAPRASLGFRREHQPGDKADFREQLSTIDDRGFFLSVVASEGTLEPRAVKLVRTQSWTPNAKFKAVVATLK